MLALLGVIARMSSGSGPSKGSFGWFGSSINFVHGAASLDWLISAKKNTKQGIIRWSHCFRQQNLERTLLLLQPWSLESIKIVTSAKEPSYIRTDYNIPFYWGLGKRKNLNIPASSVHLTNGHLHAKNSNPGPCLHPTLFHEAGFRTYAERESLRGMPRKTDPDSVPLLPEDVYEDLVPVLRNDVREQWRRRIEDL